MKEDDGGEIEGWATEPKSAIGGRMMKRKRIQRRLLPIIKGLTIRPSEIDTATKQRRQDESVYDRVLDDRINIVRRHSAVPNTGSGRLVDLR